MPEEVQTAPDQKGETAPAQEQAHDEENEETGQFTAGDFRAFREICKRLEQSKKAAQQPQAHGAGEGDTQADETP